MEITFNESDVSLLSPEAEAVASNLMGWYGKTLISLHMAVYCGIMLSGSIVMWTGAEINHDAAATAWLFQGATGLLMARELAPIIWYWFTIGRKSDPIIEPLPMVFTPPLMQMKPIKKRDRSGFVYLIQSPTGAYKIGRTSDPSDRIKTFNVKLPFEVQYLSIIKTDDMYALERELHVKFADRRIDGEWFKLTPDDVKYIIAIEANDDLDNFLESVGIA